MERPALFRSACRAVAPVATGHAWGGARPATLVGPGIAKRSTAAWSGSGLLRCVRHDDRARRRRDTPFAHNASKVAPKARRLRHMPRHWWPQGQSTFSRRPRKRRRCERSETIPGGRAERWIASLCSHLPDRAGAVRPDGWIIFIGKQPGIRDTGAERERLRLPIAAPYRAAQRIALVNTRCTLGSSYASGSWPSAE